MRRHWIALAAGVAIGIAAPGSIPAADDLPAVSARYPRLVEDAAPMGPTVRERLVEIQRRVQRAASYPPIARARGVVGEAVVAFEIGADGLAFGVAPLESSGSGALDRAAIRAVERAGVLPYVYGRVAVPVRFTLRDDD